MNNVPNMISTKDASYLKDMFNWNIIALKKFNVYNEYINDKEIINIVKKLITMHKANCEEILNILGSDINE